MPTLYPNVRYFVLTQKHNVRPMYSEYGTEHGKLSFQNWEMLLTPWLIYLFLHENFLLCLHPVLNLHLSECSWLFHFHLLYFVIVNRQITLSLPSICGTSVKSLHCPPNFNNLMNKILLVMAIPFGLLQVVAARSKLKNLCDIA